MNNIDILEEDVKNILNCCTDIETLISLDERAKEDLKNNTHNIQQQEVLTIIREFIRCKNDCSNLIAENKELKEENKKMEELIENSECDMSTNYIRKSKVEELLKEKIEWCIKASNSGLNAIQYACSKEDEIERIERQKNISTMISILKEMLQELLDERNNTDE